MPKKFYTTGEIARITGISLRTIKNYCTQGKIISESTPLTNYRRISKESLIRFLTDNKLPLDLLTKYVEKKVLIVDDEESIVTLFSEFVRTISENILIETALNGYEACIKAGVFQPDVILLDIQMPGIDGFEVCKSIRTVKETSAAEIIVITGLPLAEVTPRLKQYNVKRFFNKPIDFIDLKTQLLESLSLRELAAEGAVHENR